MVVCTVVVEEMSYILCCEIQIVETVFSHIRSRVADPCLIETLLQDYVGSRGYLANTHSSLHAAEI